MRIILLTSCLIAAIVTNIVVEVDESSVIKYITLLYNNKILFVIPHATIHYVTLYNQVYLHCASCIIHSYVILTPICCVEHSSSSFYPHVCELINSN